MKSCVLYRVLHLKHQALHVARSVTSCRIADDAEEVLRLCRDCLAKVKDVLSPFNVYLLRVLDRAFDAAISGALWEEALGYGIQTLQPYRSALYSFRVMVSDSIQVSVVLV